MKPIFALYMHKNDRIFKAHLALIGANLFYGAGYTIAKTVMPELIQPLGFIVIRVVISALLFWLTIFGGPKYNAPIQKRDWLVLVLGGLFGVAINQMLFFYGLNLTLPIHASLIMMSSPLLITIIAAIAARAWLSWDKIFGLLLGIGGATLLMLGGGKSLGSSASSTTGDFFLLLNSTSYALYFVMIKPLIKRYRPVVVVRWVFLFGTAFVIPFGWGEFVAIDWSLFTGTDYAAVAFMVICCTFLTYLWNTYGLQVLTPSTAGAYIYLQPVFAAFISMVWFGESLSWVKVIAALLIFSGVYMVNFGLAARLKRLWHADRKNSPPTTKDTQEHL